MTDAAARALIRKRWEKPGEKERQADRIRKAMADHPEKFAAARAKPRKRKRKKA